MPTEIAPGSFADAGIADLLPPDDSGAHVPDPIPGVRDTKLAPKPETKVDPPANPETAKSEVVKPETAKPDAKDELANPHLSTTPEAAKPGDTDASGEMPADLKKGMTEAAAKKASAAWASIQASEKKWKTQAEEHSTALKTATAELESVKKQVAELEGLKKELETTRKTLGDYEQEMSVTRVEGTKAYKDAVSGPMTDITSAVDEIAKRYEVPAHTLMSAIAEPDREKRDAAIDEAISDFKPTHQHEIVQAARDYQRAQKAATDMKANAGEKIKELEAAAKAEDEKVASYNANQYRTSLGDAWQQLQDKTPFLRKVEGKDAWNAYLDSLKRDAEGVDPNNLSLGNLAQAVAAHRALPDVVKVAIHFQNENKSLREKLEAAEKRIGDKRELSAGAGSGSTVETNGSASKKGGSFVDSVMT